MNIELIEYKEGMITTEGKYLIRTESNYDKEPHLFTIPFFIKNGKMCYSISNQRITHISTKPVF